MDTLQKRAAGDWFEIKERLRRPDELYEILCPDEPAVREVRPAVLAAVAGALEEAVEGGVFEVRRHGIAEILGELAEAEFSSEVFGRLPELYCRSTALVLVGALQRALLAGDLAFHSGSGEAEPSGSTLSEIENREINEIIQDIKEIVAGDPSAKMNAAIKNVLLQVQKYREEAATFKKLKEQATDYRLEMYTKTFSATFKQIFESIRKNYGAYLEEQEAKRREDAGSPLDGVETKGWLRLLQGNLETMSWVRSVIGFAMVEHSGMRGPMVKLSRRRDDFIGKIDEERVAAVAACGGDEERTRRLSRLISIEAAGWLRKQGEE
ncbi:MAG: hypothetical protein ACOCYQ_01675 [Alkalispirochaeta sp.]